MKTIDQYTGSVTRTKTVGGQTVTETFATENDIALETKTVGGTTKIYIALADGKDAQGFIIADAIRTLVGELQLDTARGIDYENTIWTNPNRLSSWKGAVRQKVLGYDFVKSIESFDTSVADNVLTYKLVIRTTDGDSVTVTN